VLALSAEAYVEDVPNDFQDIEGRNDSQHWYQAVLEEIQALKQNNTWTMTKLPPGRRAISSRWIFRLKRDKDGNPERYKAIPVVKGCSQKKGPDYDEVYAPVARLTTVRTLLSIINKEDLHAIHQLDVKTSDGIKGKNDHVLKLNKSIYGLKQAPRVWNERFDVFAKEIGFQQSPHDRCL